MFLDTTTRKLQIVLTTAMTTSNMPVVVDWVDMTTTSTTAGVTPSNTNGVTAVDILPAPAASTQRKVNGISIYNQDTAAKTVHVLFNDNGTTYQILDMTLNVDDVLAYTDVKGWYVLDVNGNTKTIATTTANSIASSIHGAPNKTTPVDADEIGIWDSVSALLNKVSWANIKAALKTYNDTLYAALAGSASQVFSVAPATATTHAVQSQQVSWYPTVASAATIDIFGAAGATINVSGTTTITGITACTAAQVGSIKTIIPSNAAGFSITASANIIVDGATSGTYLMPQDANIQVIATSTTMVKITTIAAAGLWTPVLGGSGGQSGQTYVQQQGVYKKTGSEVFATFNVYLTSVGSITGGLEISGLPFTASVVPTGGLFITYFTGLATNVYWLTGRVEGNTTRCTLSMMTAASTTVSAMSQGDLSTPQLMGTIIYRTQ